MARRLTLKEVEDYVSKNSKCILISKEYKNSHTNLKFTCEKCLQIFETSFDSFKHQNKHLCDECGRKLADKRRMNKYEDIYNYILETGCELIGEYKGINKPLKLKCGCCGEIFYCTLDSYRYKKHKRCEKCNRKISDGELIFEDLLKSFGIEYIHQYGFDDCKYKNKLNFDFYLPKYNTLVEVDGRQHRVVIEYFGGIEEFYEIQARDETKNNYCKDNNIQLVRIDYDGIHKEVFTEQCEKEIKNILNNSISVA